MVAPPPPRLSGIAAKLLIAYTEWHALMTKHVPKSLRYSLGIRIDGLFCDVIARVSSAQFSTGDERLGHLARGITANDTLKFMFYALYELKGIDETRFFSLSAKAEEVGRMLYGWKQKSAEHLRRPGNTRE